MHPFIPVVAIVAFARHHRVSSRKSRYARKRVRKIRRNPSHRRARARRNCPGDRCPSCNAPVGQM